MHNNELSLNSFIQKQWQFSCIRPSRWLVTMTNWANAKSTSCQLTVTLDWLGSCRRVHGDTHAWTSYDGGRILMFRQQQSPFVSHWRRWRSSILTLERRKGGLQLNNLKTSSKFEQQSKFIQGTVMREQRCALPCVWSRWFRWRCHLVTLVLSNSRNDSNELRNKGMIRIICTVMMRPYVLKRIHGCHE